MIAGSWQRLAALLLVGGIGLSPVRADEPAPEAWHRGEVLLQNAARWLQRGRDPDPEVRDVYLDLEDVRVADAVSRHEGFLRIWYVAPDRFRLEQRAERARTQFVTKILHGDDLAFIGLDGRPRAAGRDADGVRARAQLAADRERFADLARYLTLGALGGEGVRFEDRGRLPSGEEGLPDVLHVVRRHAPGEPPTDLWFETAEAPRTVGDLRRVHLGADEAAGMPARRWHMDAWRDVPADGRRMPGRVESWTYGTAGPQRTLLAHLARVRVNGDIPDALFHIPE